MLIGGRPQAGEDYSLRLRPHPTRVKGQALRLSLRSKIGFQSKRPNLPIFSLRNPLTRAALGRGRAAPSPYAPKNGGAVFPIIGRGFAQLAKQERA